VHVIYLVFTDGFKWPKIIAGQNMILPNMSDHTIIMAEIKFADVTTIMRSIVHLIVMGRLCELCMILLVDSMLVYAFLQCMLFYAVADCVEKVGSVGPRHPHPPTRPQFYSGARPWLG
jgi:hypothetical protein